MADAVRDLVRTLVGQLRDRLQQQEDEILRLREALEPFAYLDCDIGDEWRDACERARRALTARTTTTEGER